MLHTGYYMIMNNFVVIYVSTIIQHLRGPISTLANQVLCGKHCIVCACVAYVCCRLLMKIPPIKCSHHRPNATYIGEYLVDFMFNTRIMCC